MKKSLLTLALLLSNCLTAFSQATSLTVDCQTPGWLSSLLTYSQQTTIEELILTGYVNKTDIDFVNGLIKNYNLKVLDLSNVTTISNGKEHYLWNKFLSFGSNKILQKVRLPLIIEGASGSGSVVCSKVDTLEIGWEDLSVIGEMKIWNNHAKHLILLDGVRIIPNRYFMTQEDYDATYNNQLDVDYHVSMPNTITKIGGRAFGRYAGFNESFSFPDDAEYIGRHPLEYQSYKGGNYGHAAENCWCERIPSISDKTFSFPAKMRFYNSLDYTTMTDGSTKSIITCHEFVSDTIIVSERCDTLFAKLRAKVAYFYSKTPTQLWSPDDLWIDTLYVPDGCLSAYQNNEVYRMAQSTEPNNGYGHGHLLAIKEMKVSVTGITLNQSTLQFDYIGEIANLEATVLPEDAANKNIRWKSSDESVCIVSNGMIVAVGMGTSVVIATTEDGGFMAVCVVTVTSATGISSVEQNNEKLLQFFDINGVKRAQLQKGINIIQFKDGTKKKVFVR